MSWVVVATTVVAHSVDQSSGADQTDQPSQAISLSLKPIAPKPIALRRSHITYKKRRVVQQVQRIERSDQRILRHEDEMA